MDIKKQVQEQFGKSAHHYVTSDIHARGNDLAALLSVAAPKNTDVVLDIATGGGHVANGFAPLVQRVVALDLTKRMLEKAEEFIHGNGHTNVTFVQGDAEALPFADASFTTVACRIAPHHFPNAASFVAESYRVLQPGGTFLLIDNVAPEKDSFDVFYNTVEKRRDPSHHRAFKKSEWLSMLEHAGFTTKQLHTFSKTFQYDSWFDRMGLPQEEKKALEAYMKSADEETKQHFHTEETDGRVVSFQGQSILALCKK